MAAAAAAEPGTPETVAPDGRRVLWAGWMKKKGGNFAKVQSFLPDSMKAYMDNSLVWKRCVVAEHSMLIPKQIVYCWIGFVLTLASFPILFALTDLRLPR